MAKEYAPLPRSSLELESAVHDSDVKPALHSTSRSWKTYALALSLLADILLAVLYGHVVAIWEEGPESHSQSPHLHQGIMSDNSAGLSKQPTNDIPFQWWSAYSSPNATDDDAVDNAWDAIAKDFGLVAVDHNRAKKIGAPSTMDLPSDPTKGIYVVGRSVSLPALPGKPATTTVEALDEYLAYQCFR